MIELESNRKVTLKRFENCLVKRTMRPLLLMSKMLFLPYGTAKCCTPGPADSDLLLPRTQTNRWLAAVRWSRRFVRQLKSENSVHRTLSLWYSVSHYWGALSRHRHGTTVSQPGGPTSHVGLAWDHRIDPLYKGATQFSAIDNQNHSGSIPPNTWISMTAAVFLIAPWWSRHSASQLPTGCSVPAGFYTVRST